MKVAAIASAVVAVTLATHMAFWEAVIDVHARPAAPANDGNDIENQPPAQPSGHVCTIPYAFRPFPHLPWCTAYTLGNITLATNQPSPTPWYLASHHRGRRRRDASPWILDVQLRGADRARAVPFPHKRPLTLHRLGIEGTSGENIVLRLRPRKLARSCISSNGEFVVVRGEQGQGERIRWAAGLCESVGLQLAGMDEAAARTVEPMLLSCGASRLWSQELDVDETIDSASAGRARKSRQGIIKVHIASWAGQDYGLPGLALTLKSERRVSGRGAADDHEHQQQRQPQPTLPNANRAASLCTHPPQPIRHYVSPFATVIAIAGINQPLRTASARELCARQNLQSLSFSSTASSHASNAPASAKHNAGIAPPTLDRHLLARDLKALITEAMVMSPPTVAKPAAVHGSSRWVAKNVGGQLAFRADGSEPAVAMGNGNAARRGARRDQVHQPRTAATAAASNPDAQQVRAGYGGDTRRWRRCASGSMRGVGESQLIELKQESVVTDNQLAPAPGKDSGVVQGAACDKQNQPGRSRTRHSGGIAGDTGGGAASVVSKNKDATRPEVASVVGPAPAIGIVVCV